jgi:hypothetical protein
VPRIAADANQTAASGEIVGKPAIAHKTSLDTARRRLDNPSAFRQRRRFKEEFSGSLPLEGKAGEGVGS